jgi:hypothetical protein
MTNIAKKLPQNLKKTTKVQKVAQNHEYKAKMVPNGVFGQFLDVFVFLMTKK